MSDDGIVKYRVVIDFDAMRARFDKNMFVHLEVWDEIRKENIRITPDVNGPSSDLNRPGEGFKNMSIIIRKDD